MKMTFQPKKRSRSKVHGFRKRMSTASGRKSFSSKKIKRKKEIISLRLRPQLCGLFFFNKEK